MTTSRSFFYLCTLGVFCFISYNLVRMPVLSLFAESLGAGPERIGLIVSVSTITGVLLKLPSGALSDIYGRKMLLRIGVVAFGLPPFIYPFISDLNALTALRFVHGLATAIFAPSALATVADLYKERRGAALGTYTACTQSGSLLGPFLGGWLAYTAGFSTAFVTAGVFGCIAILIFFSLHLDEPPPRVRERGLAPVMAEMGKGFLAVARNRKVLITSSTDAAKMVANGALMAFLPLYGLSVGLNAGQVGLLFSVQAVTSFLSKPVMGRVSDRVGRQPLILAGLLICAATFISMPHVGSFALLLVLSSGFGFGEAVVSSSSAALVADSSEFKRLGAGMGMQGTVMDIGHASGPLLAGLLIAHVSYQGAFAVIAGLQILAAIAFWATMRTLSR
ncbi:MAG: MFS transporter [Nitrospira sp.]|jgi:DHA1 family multidrug resistance protein-like MFS transporter|nr:MFS transporter [Nitrospira sp.]OYT23700.1 MAG: MFS transporter [Nitrospira sp. UW-LDO-02]MBK7486631.1 MFS transporter [Nitrospira sp.]MBK8378456.1 MFS transporter [Nitrospira sp.]MBK9111328.1 MFS transporter [Nitrospira sp.]